MRLQALDSHLLNLPPKPELSGVSRFASEFLYFRIKEARACRFAGLFFAVIFCMPRAGLWGIPRYDALLVIALAI